MWIIHHLPPSFLETIINLLLLVGLGGTLATVLAINTILRFLPIFSHYYRIAQVIFVCVFLLGVYMKGAFTTEQSWRQKVAEVELKLKDAEIQSAKTNTVITEKIITKTKIVREQVKTAADKIRTIVVPHDKECVLSPDIIEAHDAAIRLLSEPR